MELVLLLFFVTANCASNFNFSTELLQYAAQQTGGQVVISPYGIWTLMAELALGTTDNSYKQISTAFDFPKNQEDLINDYQQLTNDVLSPKTDQVQLSSNNFVFVDQSFEVLPDYKKAIQDDLNSAFKVLDFGDSKTAVEEANSLIESVAGVTNVLKPDQFSDRSMILTNVISFKGLWKSPFDTSYTVKETFYDENNAVIGSVNMMFKTGKFPCSNIEELQSTVLELSYGNDGKYSMLFMLPHPHKKATEVCQHLSKFGVKDILEALQKDVDEFGMEKIDVKIPRFRITTDISMTETLKNMGINDVFDNTLGKFEKLSKQEVFVSAIIHKADIEVTEEGTAASAVSVAELENKMLPPTFYASRPFGFLVVEKPTSTVLFSGIYSNPTEY